MSSGKKEVSKSTAVVIVIVAVIVILVVGFLVFFKPQKVQPVAETQAQLMPPEMKQKLQESGMPAGAIMGGGQGQPTPSPQ